MTCACRSYILQGHSVVWVLTILSAILALSRGVLPEEEESFDPKKSMKNVASYLLVLPDEVVVEPALRKSYYSFRQLFNFQLIALVEEILSPLVCPFIFLMWLPQQSQQIAQFFKDNTHRSSRAGLVCAYAAFDEQDRVCEVVFSGSVDPHPPLSAVHRRRAGWENKVRCR
jgi:autophagy-related protein 9